MYDRDTVLWELKQRVLAANLLLPKYGLVTFTWGNVSEIWRPPEGAGQDYVVAIKPSGVEYEAMTADDIVIVDLDGRIIEGRLKPSSDTATHLELYRRFPHIGGVVHTHSRYATAFAQAKLALPALGTTHADYFHGEVPCTRDLTPAEIANDYELNTGRVIAETCDGTYERVPACLVASHGPFVWGTSASDAVHNAAVLEEVAAMATLTLSLNPNIAGPSCASGIERELLDKHYLRKHGAGAYYGQK